MRDVPRSLEVTARRGRPDANTVVVCDMAVERVWDAMEQKDATDGSVEHPTLLPLADIDGGAVELSCFPREL